MAFYLGSLTSGFASGAQDVMGLYDTKAQIDARRASTAQQRQETSMQKQAFDAGKQATDAATGSEGANKGQMRAGHDATTMPDGTQASGGGGENALPQGGANPPAGTVPNPEPVQQSPLAAPGQHYGGGVAPTDLSLADQPAHLQAIGSKPANAAGQPIAGRTQAPTYLPTGAPNPNYVAAIPGVAAGQPAAGMGAYVGAAPYLVNGMPVAAPVQGSAQQPNGTPSQLPIGQSSAMPLAAGANASSPGLGGNPLGASMAQRTGGV